MTNQKSPISNDDPRKQPIKLLFILCEAWLTGRVTDEVFARRVREEQIKALEAEWGPYENGDEKMIQNLYENAQRCVLAVQKSIEDIRMFAKTPDDPPVALRACYFGTYVDRAAILDLDTMLRMPYQEPPGPDGTLQRDFNL